MTEPNRQNFDPFISCTFITDQILFVNLFHNHEDQKNHYHFLYDAKKRCIIGNQFVVLKLVSTTKNFPVKCFYNPDLNEIYSFYKEGQIFIINADNIQDYFMEQQPMTDFGQIMYSQKHNVIVTQSSARITFYKI